MEPRDEESPAADSDRSASYPPPNSDEQKSAVTAVRHTLERIKRVMRAVSESGAARGSGVDRFWSSIDIVEASVQDRSGYLTTDLGAVDLIPPTYLREIQRLIGSVVDLVNDQAAVHDLARTLDDTMTRGLEEAQVRLDSHPDKDALNGAWAAGNIAALRERLTINALVDRATFAAASAGRAEADAQRAAVHSKEAAGDAAAGELSEHFETLADHEHRAATVWRAIALSLGFVVSGVALLVLGDAEDLSAVDAVRKIAVGFPLAVMAAYSARESSGHRSTYLWARRVEVQLRTMRAFIEPLDDQLRQAVLTIVAFRAFADQPNSAGGEGAGNPPMAVGELDEVMRGLVGRLLEIPSQRGGQRHHLGSEAADE